MKNAIWSAIPNFTFVAGGDPYAIAISAIASVGMGYMNYRKEKAKISLENEEEEWKLQRSAIEQFNGLRREMFDTAWRLADMGLKTKTDSLRKRYLHTIRFLWILYH